MLTLKKGPFQYCTGDGTPNPVKPDMLFIHGAALSKELWAAQIQGLDNTANPMAVDLQGHGGSEGPGRNTIAGYAKDMFRFINDAGLSHDNLILCGMSMGGAVVQQLLIDHPGRFKAAVLINTGARLKVLPAVFDAVAQDFSAFIRSMPAFSLSPSTDVTRFEPQILAFSGLCDAKTALGDFEACNTFDVMEKITSITCPVLVITAEHDMSTPPKYGTWLKDHLPQSSLVQIREAGHLSMVEKADEVNESIRAFITRL